VLWKLVKRSNQGTKIPVQVGGEPARTNDPETWDAFESVARAWRAKPRAYKGIGYVFSPEDAYVGIDLDGCILADGEIAEWAKPWLEAFRGCYMEISPSGRGIKIWVRGRLPGPGTKRTLDGSHVGIEAYDQGRFFYITGDVFGEAVDGIPERQEAVERVYAWIQEGKKKLEPAAPTSNGRAHDLHDLIERRVIPYLARCEPSVSGQDGHGRALFAAVRIGPGFGLPEDLTYSVLAEHFNPRCLPPWSEKELRRKVSEAYKVESRRGFLLDKEPPRNGAPKTNGRPRQVTDLDAQLAKKMRTDLGNGERLVARYGRKIRYCTPWGKWLVWDGRRYALDKTRVINRIAKKTTRAMYEEAATIQEDAERKALAMHAMATESRPRIEAMIAMASAEAGVPVLPEELDRDGWLFNCLNGTIDLRTGRLRPHSQADLITQLCPVEFDPHAKCPLWDATLELFFMSDRRLIAYWQRLCGNALVGVVRDHVMPVAYGTGSNGKSTILGTLMALMGDDYAMKAPPAMLMAKAHETHPTDRADLFGKRLVIAIETESGRRLDEVMVKELTGGDRIRARRMREDFWEFSSTHTLIMATNHKPVIRGTDHGIWRRLKLVPFSVQVDGEQADTSMPERLRAEFPGILAWCVRGCLAWQEIGLNEPDCVRAATDEYRSEQDVIGTFLEERTLQERSIDTRCNRVYEAY
jgi:putative DNA primase/helicase